MTNRKIQRVILDCPIVPNGKVYLEDCIFCKHNEGETSGFDEVHCGKDQSNIITEKITKIDKDKIEIVVSQRSKDHHACVKDHPEIWAPGQSGCCAIGNLVVSHPEIFGIVKVNLEGL